METDFFSATTSMGGNGESIFSNQTLKYIAIAVVAAGIAYAVYYFFFRKERHHEKKGSPQPSPTPPSQTDTPKVVLYHMKGCGFCTTFRPIWDAAKQKYSQLINFVEHQYPEEKDFILTTGVTAFPTVHAVKNGSAPGVFQLTGNDYAAAFDVFLRQQFHIG